MSEARKRFCLWAGLSGGFIAGHEQEKIQWEAQGGEHPAIAHQHQTKLCQLGFGQCLDCTIRNYLGEEQ